MAPKAPKGACLRPLACALLVHALACAGNPSPADPETSGRARRVTFSILEDYDKGDDLTDVAKDFELFRQLNISTWRGSFGWDDYEPDPGQYDFDWLHRFIEAAERHRIVLRPYIAYTPDWAAGGEDRDGQAWNQPPKDLRAFAGFVRALAAEVRHHRNVPSIEVYNEQNVAQWWEGTVTDYAATLRAASEAARGFEILAGGLVFPDIGWVEGLCRDRRARAAFSILPVHAYPETWTPADVTVESYLGEGFREDFVPETGRLCGPKRIWINETGYATTPGRTEEDQARWWVRAIATFAAEPRVEHIGVYEIKDLAPDRPAIGDAPNYHLGLTRVDRRPKLAFSTVRMMAGLLAHSFTVEDADVSRPSAAGELHHRMFRRGDGSRVLAIWNRTADEEVSIRLPSATTLVEHELDARTVPRDAPDARLSISLRRGAPRVFEIR